MLKGERVSEILSYMRECRGFVTVRNLCERLYASESSIRRDLTDMEKRGLIKRSYGGAELMPSYSKIPVLSLRYSENAERKREIAKKAKELIFDGAIIFLDQSSSALHLAEAIKEKSSLTVITNNIEVIHTLAESNIRVISSGGYLFSENRTCLIGSDAIRIFTETQADLLFFSCRGVTDEGELTDLSREEVLLRSYMIRNAKKTVFLCDSTKFGISTPYKQCSLSDIDYLVCDDVSYAENLKREFNSLNVI